MLVQMHVSQRDAASHIPGTRPGCRRICTLIAVTLTTTLQESTWGLLRCLAEPAHSFSAAQEIREGRAWAAPLHPLSCCPCPAAPWAAACFVSALSYSPCLAPRSPASWQGAQCFSSHMPPSCGWGQAAPQTDRQMDNVARGSSGKRTLTDRAGQVAWPREAEAVLLTNQWRKCDTSCT